MAVGTIAAMANGFSSPLMIFISGDLINAFGVANKDNVVHLVSKVIIKYVYLAIGSGVASFLEVSCWMVIGERQATRIRGLYLKTILRQDIAFFDNETKTGEVIGRMSRDTILIQEAIGEKVGKFMQLVTTFFGGFIIAFIRGWHLSLVLMSFVPLIVISGVIISIITSAMSTREQDAYVDAGNVVEQTIGAMRTVASFTGEKLAISKYNQFIKVAYKSTIRQWIISGVGGGVVWLIVFSTYSLAIWYGGKLILQKEYNGGTVINIVMAVLTSGMSLGQALPCVTAFGEGQAAAYKMFETIKRKPAIDAYDTNGMVLEDIKGVIDLKDVTFSYPSRPDHLIFDGFSLHVHSGKTMALVGESGSGKSTVFSLLERFYDPQGGEVLIDGVNLKNLNLKWIREKIGLVSQEPILFTMTIRENIAYGKEGATPEEIRTAVELANAANFIDNMHNGLDTMVGEHGTQLSGGQKQRIAIARSILKNPKILLLDEATSALDAESERIIQEALVKVLIDRTTIIVAHRLGTVKNADTIAVVYRGKLVEQGSHANLMSHPEGAYSQLIRLQENQKHDKEEPYKHSQNMVLSNDTVTPIVRSESHRSTRRSTSKGSKLISQNNNREDDFEKPLEKDNNGIRKQVSIKRLASLNKPEAPILALASIIGAINGLTMPMFGFLLSSAIQTFYEPPHELRKHSSLWALRFLAMGFLCLVVSPVVSFLFGMAGGKLVERIRSLSFERVVYQEISWFDEPSHSSGAICERLSADATTVSEIVGESLSQMVQILSMVIAGLVIAMIANWKLAFIVIALLPLICLQGYAKMKFSQGFSADAKYEEASQVANDAVGNIRTVASFCAETRVIKAYQNKCEGPLRNGVRQGIISGLGFGFSFAVLYVGYAICFYAGARFMHNGSATFDQVFKVFYALTMAASGVLQSSASGTKTNKAKDSAASIFEILDNKSKIDSSTNEGVTLAYVRGDIVFQHVSFKYPTRPEVQIFKDLCLTISFGKTVALVGESGSGKSTIIAMLERFYDPDSGMILLDGVKLQDLKISWLRQQMGLVSQEPVLFNDTIRANIAYGKQGQVSEEEIIAVAETANAHRFVSGLPQGYDTNVGERGAQLSGGQKQRIAIARAIIKDPKILLLDEATSALDAESEHVVQEALQRVMVGRTCIVVAHRLSTIKGADVIAVIKNGVIVEQGKHEELIELCNGAYASLVALHSTSSS
ncbi:ABC transporter B family member 4-like [Dioscorea cayenensis subsp. rotundata]|uniref:ABC transporter B family member 4-like n=1 Tax=Dioscorea cayennensis subsp. rotundata TaxID=55577 RepID=A0AB40C0S8_DIOCR|nr:ABC transporter B family member 4-like [Dioscorea cayenensis subsp. rotundata]